VVDGDGAGWNEQHEGDMGNLGVGRVCGGATGHDGPFRRCRLDVGAAPYDGSRWERVNDTGTEGPRAIVGTSGDDVYAIGRFPGGGASHWDGISADPTANS
jgi:hypothetical protein